MSFLTALRGANVKRKNYAAMHPQTPKTSQATVGKNGFAAAMKNAAPIGGVKPYQVS